MIFLVVVIILSILIWYGYNTFSMFSGNIENEYIYRVINGQPEMLSQGWGNIWHYTVSIILLVGITIAALILSYYLFKNVLVITDSELQEQKESTKKAEQKAIKAQKHYQSEAERITNKVKANAQEQIESAYQYQRSVIQDELSEKLRHIEQELSTQVHDAQKLKQQAEKEREFYQSEYKRLKAELENHEKKTTHSKDNAVAAMNRRKFKKPKQP